MDVFNLFGNEWDGEEEHDDFKVREVSVGARVGAELIGGSVYEVAPARSSGRITPIRRTRSG